MSNVIYRLLGKTVELTAPVFSASDRFEVGTRGKVRTLHHYPNGAMYVEVVAEDSRSIDEISVDKLQEVETK